MSELLYLEQKVADRLGISRRDLKSVRDEILEKETGWRIHKRDVALTLSGLESVLSHLRLSDRGLDFTECAVPVNSEKKDGAEDIATKEHPHVNGLTELTVLRTYPNPRLLQALTDDGGLVTVGVKTNLNFRPKMKLKARLIKAGRYELEGRCPRFPGRY